MKLLLLLLLIPLINIPEAITKETQSDNTLINKKWQMEEIRFLQDNIPYHYKRGGNSTTFDDDYICFYDSGKGIYHQGDGNEYPLEWKQNGANELVFTIRKFRFNEDLVVTWEHLIYNSQNMSYTEYYTHANGIHSLAHGVRSSCGSSQQYVSNIQNDRQ